MIWYCLKLVLTFRSFQAVVFPFSQVYFAKLLILILKFCLFYAVPNVKLLMCCSFLTTSNCPVEVAKRKSWRFWQLAGNRWQSWNRWARVLGFVVVQEVMKAFGSGKKMHLWNLVLVLRTKIAWRFREGRWVLNFLFLLTSGLLHNIQFNICRWHQQHKCHHSSKLLLFCWRMKYWHWALDLVLLFLLSLSELWWHWPYSYCFGLPSGWGCFPFLCSLETFTII